MSNIETPQLEDLLYIFPFENTVSETEKNIISKLCTDFLKQWKSHGEELSTQFWIEEDRILIFSVDPSISNPSGCSKDKLYHFVNSLKDSHNFKPGDVTKFWVKTNGKIELLNKSELKELANSQFQSPKIQLFPMWITTKKEFQNIWGKPLEQFRTLLRF